MKFLVKFDLEFDLKIESSNGKNLVKFGGRTFLPARKFRGEFRGEFRRKFRKLRFKFRVFFSETSFSRRAVLNYYPINSKRFCAVTLMAVVVL